MATLQAMIGAPLGLFSAATPRTRLRGLSGVVLAALFAGVAVPTASAMTLGPINTASALGEPFSAAIAVTMPQGEPLDAECVRLLPSAGDLPSIPDLGFTVRPEGAGAFSILLRSSTRVHEPVAQVRLSVGCRNEIQRQYTVLLDPRGFAQAPVAGVTQRTASSPQAGASTALPTSNAGSQQALASQQGSQVGSAAPPSAAASPVARETSPRATPSSPSAPRSSTAARSATVPATLPRFELAPPPLARLQQAALAAEAASQEATDSDQSLAPQTSSTEAGQLRLESPEVVVPTGSQDTANALGSVGAEMAQARVLIEQINSLTAQIATLQAQMDAARQAEEQRQADIQNDGIASGLTGQGLLLGLVAGLSLLVLLLLLLLIRRKQPHADEPAISELLRANSESTPVPAPTKPSPTQPSPALGTAQRSKLVSATSANEPSSAVKATRPTVSTAGMVSRPAELSAIDRKPVLGPQELAAGSSSVPVPSSTGQVIVESGVSSASAAPSRVASPELAGMTFERLDRNTLRAPIEVAEVELDPELLTSVDSAQTIDLTRTLPFGETSLGTPSLGIDLELDTAIECNRVLTALLAVLNEAEDLVQADQLQKAADLLLRQLNEHPDSGPAPWLLLMHVQRKLGDEPAVLESGLRFTAHFGHEPPTEQELSGLLDQTKTDRKPPTDPSLRGVLRDLWGRPELLSFLYNEIIEPQDIRAQQNYGLLKELMRLAAEHGVPRPGDLPSPLPDWLT